MNGHVRMGGNVDLVMGVSNTSATGGDPFFSISKFALQVQVVGSLYTARILKVTELPQSQAQQTRNVPGVVFPPPALHHPIAVFACDRDHTMPFSHNM